MCQEFSRPPIRARGVRSHIFRHTHHRQSGGCGGSCRRQPPGHDPLGSGYGKGSLRRPNTAHHPPGDPAMNDPELENEMGAMVVGFPKRDKFSARADRGFRCAWARVRVCRSWGSNRSNAGHLRASADNRSTRGGGEVHAVSHELQQRAFRHHPFPGILPPVFQKQKDGLAQAFKAFLLGEALPVRLGHFRAKRNKPIALAVDFRIQWNVHSVKMISEFNRAQEAI